MAIIRARCPRCGDVDLSPEELRVFVRGYSSEGTYRFVCPECVHLVERGADTHIVALMSTVGVVTVLGRIDEVTDPFAFARADRILESRPEGACLTPDDLISWHFLLADDESLARFLSSACG